MNGNKATVSRIIQVGKRFGNKAAVDIKIIEIGLERYNKDIGVRADIHIIETIST